MGGDAHAHPRRHLPGPAMQRHADAVGRRAGPDIFQPDPVERQPQHVRTRPIDADHPPLDRAVEPELKHRRGNLLRAQPAQQQPRRDQPQRQHQRRDTFAQQAGQRQRGQPRGNDRHQPPGARFDRQGEIGPDPQRQADRHPGKQVAALRGQGVERAHPLSPPPQLPNQAETLSPPWLRKG